MELSQNGVVHFLIFRLTHNTQGRSGFRRFQCVLLLSEVGAPALAPTSAPTPTPTPTPMLEVGEAGDREEQMREHEHIDWCEAADILGWV